MANAMDGPCHTMDGPCHGKCDGWNALANAMDGPCHTMDGPCHGKDAWNNTIYGMDGPYDGMRWMECKVRKGCKGWWMTEWNGLKCNDGRMQGNGVEDKRLHPDVGVSELNHVGWLVCSFVCRSVGRGCNLRESELYASKWDGSFAKSFLLKFACMFRACFSFVACFLHVVLVCSLVHLDPIFVVVC